MEWLSAGAGCRFAEPAHPAWSPAHPRRLAEQAAEQRSGPAVLLPVSPQKLPPGTPWFHGGTSTSLLSSLNNQNSCPV